MNEETSLKNLWMLRKNAGLSQQALGERFRACRVAIVVELRDKADGDEFAMEE